MFVDHFQFFGDDRIRNEKKKKQKCVRMNDNPCIFTYGKL